MDGHSFPYIKVSGSSYEMGYQHGAQAGELVRKYLLLIELLAGVPRRVLAHQAMQFAPRIEQLSPALTEEIQGLADGAGIGLEEAMLCQVRLEALHSRPAGCTAFAIKGSATLDGSVLAGQNQDLPPEYADVAILLHVQPNDGRPRALMFTFAGQLGYSGMNSHGVAHFANQLYGCPWQPGLPHYPLKRVLLEQSNVAGCMDILEAHPTCSAGNLVLCDGQGHIADAEIRPEGIALFEDSSSDAIIHANHYLTERFAHHESGELPDSPRRLARMRERVHRAWGGITVDTMKDILADHDGHPAGICRHGDRGMHSISGYIAEPARGMLHVRRGHGCLGDWSEYAV